MLIQTKFYQKYKDELKKKEIMDFMNNQKGLGIFSNYEDAIYSDVINFICDFCDDAGKQGEIFGLILELKKLETRKEDFEMFEKMIDEVENPYPKDVFRWDNKEKLDFDRGRFNKHNFQIWENCKEKIKQKIGENLK